MVMMMIIIKLFFPQQNSRSELNNLFVKICPLSLKNYHTTYREKRRLWYCGQGQTQIWRWKWLEVQSLRLCRSSSSTVSCWDAVWVTRNVNSLSSHALSKNPGQYLQQLWVGRANPFHSFFVCLQLPISAGQGGAQTQFLWTLLWCASFSVISKCWCGKGIPPSTGSVP